MHSPHVLVAKQIFLHWNKTILQMWKHRATHFSEIVEPLLQKRALEVTHIGFNRHRYNFSGMANRTVVTDKLNQPESKCLQLLRYSLKKFQVETTLSRPRKQWHGTTGGYQFVPLNSHGWCQLTQNLASLGAKRSSRTDISTNSFHALCCAGQRSHHHPCMEGVCKL